MLTGELLLSEQQHFACFPVSYFSQVVHLQSDVVFEDVERVVDKRKVLEDLECSYHG